MDAQWQRIACYIAAALLVAAGTVAWAVITQQLWAQKIEIPPDSPRLAGKRVAGPLAAYAQASVIETHALEVGQGRTYSEISQEWLQATMSGDSALAEELAEPRNLITQATFLRASLFTSVLAYGVSALSIGLGVLVGVVGQRSPLTS